MVSACTRRESVVWVGVTDTDTDTDTDSQIHRFTARERYGGDTEHARMQRQGGGMASSLAPKRWGACMEGAARQTETDRDRQRHRDTETQRHRKKLAHTSRRGRCAAA
eukprot:750352-Rhodomonas_salina.1